IHLPVAVGVDAVDEHAHLVQLRPAGAAVHRLTVAHARPFLVDHRPGIRPGQVLNLGAGRVRQRVGRPVHPDEAVCLIVRTEPGRRTGRSGSAPGCGPVSAGSLAAAADLPSAAHSDPGLPPPSPAAPTSAPTSAASTSTDTSPTADIYEDVDPRPASSAAGRR